MKKLIALLPVLTLVFTITACSGNTEQPSNAGVISLSTQAPENTSGVDSSDTAQDSTDHIAYITLGDTITIDGQGTIVEGNIVSITSSGTYYVSGVSNNGQIRVYSKDSGTVKLILNGTDITCSSSAPIYIINAEKAVITLADGTLNYITDGGSYIFESAAFDEPNAAIFSNDDLTINGNGSLTINANYNDGIKSDDDLKITGGDITINAADDGLAGRDSITVKGGDISVNAGGDGMRATNDEDEAQGYIIIENGSINITAGTDGIQAETNVSISGGDITISSGGGSTNCSSHAGEAGNPWGNWGNPNQNNTDGNNDDYASAKAIKAGTDITITGGNINIDSSDDSIHSNGTITISGGDVLCASGDDGIHANSAITINGGNINIAKCYEGIEGAAITVNYGTIHLITSDDGINVVGGVDSSSINGRPGQNDFSYSDDNYLHINGGYIVIDATGDGMDINGPIDMTDGLVIINGPTRNDNGALDYMGTFQVTGGLLVAAGSSGMAQAPSTSSTQLSLMLTYSSAQPADTMVHIKTEDGEEILTFVPSKVYQSLVLCSPKIETSVTYIVYSGGSSTGTNTDGLYNGGTYAAGTELGSFTK